MSCSLRKWHRRLYQKRRCHGDQEPRGAHQLADYLIAHRLLHLFPAWDIGRRKNRTRVAAGTLLSAARPALTWRRDFQLATGLAGILSGTSSAPLGPHWPISSQLVPATVRRPTRRSIPRSDAAASVTG